MQCCCVIDPVSLCLNTAPISSFPGFSRILESPRFFFVDFPEKNVSCWKVLENQFGPGKSWKLMLNVLGSTGK